jgi:cytochrome P450
LPMFIAMDRPEHTGQRRTVAPAFTPAEMVRMEKEIRARTGQVLDSLPWGEQFDWVDKVSIELTTGMLALLFGFPWDDRRLLTFWSDWAGDVEIALNQDLETTRFEVLHEMAHYFQRLWIERVSAEPTPDLISMMIHSAAMSQMSPREFMGNLILLIVGGNDTTRNTMSGIVEAFDRFPDQRAIFEADATVIPNAVQECIRCSGNKSRRATSCACGTSRPTATKRCSTMPTSCSSAAKMPAGTSPSATASTAAWARDWLNCNCASCSRKCTRGGCA